MVKIDQGSERIRLDSIVTIQEDIADFPTQIHVTVTPVCDRFTPSLSIQSPLAQALMGHQVGEYISYPTRDGDVGVNILFIA
ncbi:MAG: GreA/GreB family elongation factor [Chloroflexota bacterium]